MSSAGRKEYAIIHVHFFPSCMQDLSVSRFQGYDQVLAIFQTCCALITLNFSGAHLCLLKVLMVKTGIS